MMFLWFGGTSTNVVEILSYGSKLTVPECKKRNGRRPHPDKGKLGQLDLTYHVEPHIRRNEHELWGISETYYDPISSVKICGRFQPHRFPLD